MMSTGVVMPNELTEQAQKVLNAVRSIGDWATRSEIAAAMNKNRLNPYDVAMLDLLVHEGALEVRKVDRPGLIPYEYQYLAK